MQTVCTEFPTQSVGSAVYRSFNISICTSCSRYYCLTYAILRLRFSPSRCGALRLPIIKLYVLSVSHAKRRISQQRLRYASPIISL